MERDVMRIISELSDVEISDISRTSLFEDLEFDDLGVVELIMSIENILEIMANDSMYDTKSVGELIQLIEKQVINNKINIK